VRVFLDTNVLVAAFATRGLCADVVRLVLAHHDLVVSAVVLDELQRTLGDKIGLSSDAVARVMELLRPYLAVADADTDEEAVADRESGSLSLRDPSDVTVVQSALAAKAELIVSGDRDLLEAQLPIEVLSPRAFWEKLRTQPPSMPAL
jgi:putative PIN family toxin of toxin-antitoxin system